MKKFFVVLAALMAVTVSTACGMGAQQPPAPQTAPPISDTEHIRNLQREVSELKGRNTERDARRKKNNGCPQRCPEQPAPATAAQPPAPPAPAPRPATPRPAPAATRQQPAATSSYECEMKVVGEAAVEAAKRTNYVECGPKVGVPRPSEGAVTTTPSAPQARARSAYDGLSEIPGPDFSRPEPQAREYYPREREPERQPQYAPPPPACGERGHRGRC